MVVLVFMSSLLHGGNIDKISYQYDKYYYIYLKAFDSIIKSTNELMKYKDYKSIFIIPTLIIYDTTIFLKYDSTNFYQSIGIDTITNHFIGIIQYESVFYRIDVDSNIFRGTIENIDGFDKLFHLKEYLNKLEKPKLIYNDLMCAFPFYFSYIDTTCIRTLLLRDLIHDIDWNNDELLFIFKLNSKGMDNRIYPKKPMDKIEQELNGTLKKRINK